MTLNCSVVSVTRIVTKRLKIELHGFQYKVRQHLSYATVVRGFIFRDPTQFINVVTQPTTN